MVIVCEGKNDKNKLQSIFKDAFIITTNGSEISKETLNTIKELSYNNEIILCLDPDGPGERIRTKIMNFVPLCHNVYAKKENAISKNKRKVGIEHMSVKDILKIFENYRPTTNKGNISYIDIYKLGLADSRILRNKLCEKINISYCNAKQLLKRLNALGFTIDKVKEYLWLLIELNKF